MRAELWTNGGPPQSRCGLWLALLLIAAPVAAAPAGERAESNATPRWNVVLVTADTLRADMLGCNGNREVATPHIDALAAAGIRFANAYTNITTTTPSHATLFSSLYPRDHKAYSNTARISSRILTLDEILARAGWHTAAIINMPWLNPDMANVVQAGREVAACKHIRKADATASWVLGFLDRRREQKRPFYLWVHFVDNHTPYHAPGKYARMYYPTGKNPRAGERGSLQRVWGEFPVHHQDEPTFKRWLRGITDVDYVIALNKGSVSWLDHHLGRIVARLKKNGQWERTLFVFTSDHGESLGEHHIWFAHSGLYEPTARVPLIIRAPGGPAGRSIETLVQLADVMPTVLARLGLDAPERVRGRDLWPLLAADQPAGSAVFLEHAGRQLTGVVTPQYKYIRHRKNKRYNPRYPLTKGREELYDLAADPQESRDLAAEKPAQLERMRRLWRELRDRRGADFAAGQAEVDAQTEEMLRSLGYTQ
jgi:arylsulfatase A-like enzyme